MAKRVYYFSKRMFYGQLIFSLIIIMLSILQLVMMFFVPSAFSIFIIPLNLFSPLVLIIIGAIILILVIIFFLIFIFKIYQIQQRKMYLHNSSWQIILIFSLFFIYFLLPSAIPLNFMSPIFIIFIYIGFLWKQFH